MKLILAFFLLITPLTVNAATLWKLDTQGASGTIYPGWKYYTSSTSSPNGGNGADGYGSQGWLLSTGTPRPATYQKGDYGQVTTASFVTTNLPITSTNSALKISEVGGPTAPNRQASWWFLDSNNYGTQGKANQTDNRASFYAYLANLKDPGLTTGNNGNANFEFSTYLCWSGGGYSKEDCPTEANNQHYYHYFNVHPGAWVHFQPDTHPAWQRNTGVPANNPAGVNHPYFYSMNGFYIQTGAQSEVGASFTLGDISLWNQPNVENDTSVTNLWVGYWPNQGHWEIGFNDGSIFYSTSGSGQLGGQTKYEVRWSTSPITNATWSTANKITPQYFRFGQTNYFRRSNAWYATAWTRFNLPAGTESSVAKIYFAVKDTSLTTDGDYHNAPDNNVKTIDYMLNKGANTVTLNAPKNLKIITQTSN